MEWVMNQIKEEDTSSRVKPESSDILTQLEMKFKKEAEDFKQSMGSFLKNTQTNPSPLWCWVTLGSSQSICSGPADEGSEHKDRILTPLFYNIVYFALCDLITWFLGILAYSCDKQSPEWLPQGNIIEHTERKSI